MDINNSTMTALVAPSVAKVASPVEAKKTDTPVNTSPEPGQARLAENVSPANAPDSKLNAAELRNLVEQTNQALPKKMSNLKFMVVEGTDINVVRIEDSETGELIRQFPSEEMVAFARTIDEMQQGAMLEEQA